MIVTVQLLDDKGTINLNITTQEDFDKKNIKFKVPFVTDFNYFSKKPTKKLSSFFNFAATPFTYTIFKEDDPSSVLYESDPHKLYFDDYMVFDSGVFSLNSKNGNPLMGMGERAGSLFYENE